MIEISKKQRGTDDYSLTIIQMGKYSELLKTFYGHAKPNTGMNS
jgi:hypothetical protein